VSGAGDSIADFVGGDTEGARSLRRALEVLRDSDLTPGLRARVEAVLGGRLTMRELAQDVALREIAYRGIDELREQLDEMSPEDRAQLVARSAAMAAADVPDQRDSDRELADP
jgi:hypothetical protein